MMISFSNDYSEGCHKNILDALNNINNNQYVGYGMDEICKEAKDRIRSVLNNQECEIHFLVGGTQTNLTIIDSLLKPYEGVISCTSGHINVHETGVIEACGHKILTINSNDGKLHAKDVRNLIVNHFEDPSFEHAVKPGLVYISNSTEIGTIYSKQELLDLHDVCIEFKIPLFMDGARLGSALTCQDNDIDITDLTKLVDVFYFGGTKNGALFGEAVVFSNPQLIANFRYLIKQKGGMLAKGWLLGVQFNELFKNNLYFDLAAHANKLALKLSIALKNMNIEMLAEQKTNQVFPIINNDILEEISIKYNFSIWEKIDNNKTCVRFCTSWATDEKDVDNLISDLNTAIKRQI